MCRDREENFEHMWVCDKAREVIDKKIVRKMEVWRGGLEGKELI